MASKTEMLKFEATGRMLREVKKKDPAKFNEMLEGIIIDHIDMTLHNSGFTLDDISPERLERAKKEVRAKLLSEWGINAE